MNWAPLWDESGKFSADDQKCRLQVKEIKCHSISTQAFSQAYSNQRKVAKDGETTEETLLQESACKEAYYMGRLLELQTEVTISRSIASNTQAENEKLSTLMQELREVSCLLLPEAASSLSVFSLKRVENQLDHVTNFISTFNIETSCSHVQSSQMLA